jgi:hypothetical protein
LLRRRRKARRSYTFYLKICQGPALFIIHFPFSQKICMKGFLILNFWRWCKSQGENQNGSRSHRYWTTVLGLKLSFLMQSPCSSVYIILGTALLSFIWKEETMNSYFALIIKRKSRFNCLNMGAIQWNYFVKWGPHFSILAFYCSDLESI